MADFSHLQRDIRKFFAGEIFCGAVGMENLLAPLSVSSRRESPVTAYHVLFTAPHRCSCGNVPFSMPLHEQWTARLSALAWRRYNGPIHLITDRRGREYVQKIGLDNAYDSVQDDLWDPYGLNQKKFWASGKLLALQRLQTPCLILDMDLVVWEPLPLDGAMLAAAHTEHLNEAFYPDKDYFLMSPRYQFPEDWDDTVEPLNTSILYLGDERLKRDYLQEAFRFMRYERDTPDNGSNCMIFAEQRILAMCAARLGICAKTFLNYDDLSGPQSLITHTWSGKHFLSRCAEAEKAFVICCQEKCRQLEDEIRDGMNMEGCINGANRF